MADASAGSVGPRIKPLVPGGLSQRQRLTYDRLISGRRGAVRGPFEAWMLVPELADRAAALGDYLRFETTLEPSLVEIAVLAVANWWRAPLVWTVHAALARQAGVAPSAIDDIRGGRAPDFGSGRERMAFELVTELLRARSVSSDVWLRAGEVLGDTEVVSLIGVAGYYVMVCMTVVAFGIDGADEATKSDGRETPC